MNNVLEDLAYAINVMAIGLGKSNSMECIVETDWGDSILVDSEKQRNIDLQEVNAGLMPEWKYKVKWQGMTEEEAKEKLLNRLKALDMMISMKMIMKIV